MDKKDKLVREFHRLYEIAKREYPDIDTSISDYNNMVAETSDYQEFLNLTTKTPNEVSNNQIDQ